MTKRSTSDTATKGWIPAWRSQRHQRDRHPQPSWCTSIRPAKKAVIVRLSANRHYGTSTKESTNRNSKDRAFLRAIAATL